MPAPQASTTVCGLDKQEARNLLNIRSISRSSTHLHEQLLLPLLRLLRQEAALLRLLLQQRSTLHAGQGVSCLNSMPGAL